MSLPLLLLLDKMPPVEKLEPGQTHLGLDPSLCPDVDPRLDLSLPIRMLALLLSYLTTLPVHPCYYL